MAGVLLSCKVSIFDASFLKNEVSDFNGCREICLMSGRVVWSEGLRETESILLARELDADLLLVNERDGRRAAKHAGVKVKGTIGVIADCIERRILAVGAAVEILMVFRDNPSEFWIDPEIIDIAIKRIKNLGSDQARSASAYNRSRLSLA